MIDCLLINSPDNFFSGDYAADPKVPLGLLYIASYVQKHGHTVALIDCHGHPYTISDVINQISEYAPRLIGINITTPNRRVVFSLAAAIKEIFSETPLVVGGPHATSMPEDIYAHAGMVDGVVVGEGELTFLKILESLPKIPRLDGVYTADDYTDNRAKTYSPRLNDLDSLPFPDFDLLDIKKYLEVSPELYLTCSRGCLYDCAFCSIRTLLGRGVSGRSATNVLDEIELLRERYGVDRFYFYDDDLMLWPGLEEFCILNAGKGSQWTAQGTLNDVKGIDQIEQFAAAGCYRMSFGFESGSYRLQKYIAKIVKERSLALLPQFQAHGVRTRGYFIFGFPQEELVDVVDTLFYLLRLRSLGLNDISVFPARPYPGTRLFTQCIDIFGKDRTDELLDFHYVHDWEAREDEILREKLRRYNTLPSFQINPAFTPAQIREIITLSNEVFFHPEKFEGISRDEITREVLKRMEAAPGRSHVAA